MYDTNETKQAELFKVLSVETRIRIIDLLKQKGPLGVNELAKELGITPSAVSQHLKVLKYAGMVRGQRKGYYLPYEVNAEALNRCQEFLTEVCTCGCKSTRAGGEVAVPETGDELSQLEEYELNLKNELKKVQARIKKLGSRKK